MKSQFRGSILGLAIGDALGYPTEFRTREIILRGFGPQGVRDFVAQHDPRFVGGPIIVGGEDREGGAVSDDTQMTMALARGLLDAGLDASLDDMMNAVAARFVEWSRSPENNRAPGATCMTGCRNLERGVAWREAGVDRSKGCGSAMRVAAIGLAFWDDHERLLEVARASSILTHGHDAGVEGAAACALMVALSLEGASALELFEAVERECCPRSPDFAACWKRLEEFWSAAPEVALSDEGIGEAWVAEEAAASALYCHAQFEDDPVEAVLTGINTDGDSDSIGCITGSIVGALHGLEAWPDRWVDEVEYRDELFEIADRLYDAHQNEVAA